MAPAIESKRGFLALVLWVLKGRNEYRVIIRIETGHSNLVSCFGPRIRALARYFTSAFASVKYLSQHPHPWAKTWHKIWMTGLNPTNNKPLSNLMLTHVDFECFITSTGHNELTHWGLVTPYDNKRSGSTLAQVMTCCLMARNYLNQCWLIISKIQWHSSRGNFTRDTSAINYWNYLKN